MGKSGTCAGRRISIHALRVEGDGRSGKKCDTFVTISIHALRVEGDAAGQSPAACSEDISIHALRVEGDHLTQNGTIRHIGFLSTPSGWRATRDGKKKDGSA